MKAGDTARLVQPEIKGTVKARKFNDSDELEVMLEWTDADGNLQTRWFTEAQLELVEA